MNADTIIARPSPQILDDMLAVAECRAEDTGGQADLRACAWNSLLHLRRRHGSLAEARAVAQLRCVVAGRATEGRAS